MTTPSNQTNSVRLATEVLFAPPSERDPKKVRLYLDELVRNANQLARHLSFIRAIAKNATEPLPAVSISKDLTRAISRNGFATSFLSDETASGILFDADSLENLIHAVRAERELFHSRQEHAPFKDAFDTPVKEGEHHQPYNLQTLCDQARSDLQAASIVVYVSDPSSEATFRHPGFSDCCDDLRIVCMSGVRYKERMRGYVGRPTPESAERIIAGNAEVYLESLSEEELTPSPDQTDLEHFALTFVQREGVHARARLAHRYMGKTQLALFVNYSTPTKFDESRKEQIRRFFWTLLQLVPPIQDRMSRPNPKLDHRISTIWQPAAHLSRLEPEEGGCSLRDYLELILDAGLAAFELKNTGFGTIHLYHPEAESFSLLAHRGLEARIEEARTQSTRAKKGKPVGVVPLVGIKGTAILIDDLLESEFRRIHHCILDGTRSQLAVPLKARNEVIGVINFESIHPGVFDEDCVRVLWSAADNAAGAIRLHREAKARKELSLLLDRLGQLAQLHSSTPENALRELAKIAKDTFSARCCDVWRYSADTNSFGEGGFTEKNRSHEDKGPRTGKIRGWSSFIQETGCLVWITGVESESTFVPYFWYPKGENWTKTPPPGCKPPLTVSPHLLEIGAKCELGLPITYNEQRVGVAWLKFGESEDLPTPNDLSQLAGITGAAAFVLKMNGAGPFFVPSKSTLDLMFAFGERAASYTSPSVPWIADSKTPRSSTADLTSNDQTP